MLIEWRGNAEDDGIAFTDAGEVGSGVEFSGGEGFRDGGRGDVLNVAGAGVKMIDFRGVDIEAKSLIAGASVGKHQGKSDIAEANDAYDRVFLLNAFEEIHE